MLSEYTASAHPPLGAAGLLASSLTMPAVTLAQVANALARFSPVDFVVLVFDVSALVGTVTQSLLFRTLTSLSFPDTTCSWFICC